MNTSRRRQLGVSLIEALVAFGVMAFGMMAVVGMQATLRTNGDLARQRAEAVRIAQDAIEEWRGFSTLASTTDRMAYADIATVASTAITGSNATYELRRQVNNDATVTGTVTPQRRTLIVDVGWTDRSGQAQAVRLSTSIAGIAPEVSASLVLAANPDPLLVPRARHRGIPAGAVLLSIGSSGYVPPGQTGSGTRVAWVFNNSSAVITLCTTTGTTSSDLLVTSHAPVCGSSQALLLSGVVRFATGTDPAASLTSVANPAGPLYPSFGLSAEQTMPDGSVNVATCYQDPLADTQVPYYCAMLVTPTQANWTGRLIFGPPLVIATSTAGFSNSEYKVCRYQADASYTTVSGAKLNQNFVIISAGGGSSSTVYQCPTTSTPPTWAHQPV